MTATVQLIQFPDNEPDLARSAKLRALALTVQQLAQQHNSAAAKTPSAAHGSAPYMVWQKDVALPNSKQLAVLAPITLNVGGNTIGLNTQLIMLEQLGDIKITTPINGQLLSWNGANWINVTRSVIAGPGLTGGGPLTADVTLSAQGSPIFIPEDPEYNDFIMPGPAGISGSTGLQGSPGPPGDDGDDAIAWPGPPGVSGVTGSSGSPGPPGEDGEDAIMIPGPTGATGPQGPQGTPGTGGGGGSTVFLPGDDWEEAYALVPGPPGAKGTTGNTGPASGAVLAVFLPQDDYEEVNALPMPVSPLLNQIPGGPVQYVLTANGLSLPPTWQFRQDSYFTSHAGAA